jgi:hypothetical protein
MKEGSTGLLDRLRFLTGYLDWVNCVTIEKLSLTILLHFVLFSEDLVFMLAALETKLIVASNLFTLATY